MHTTCKLLLVFQSSAHDSLNNVVIIFVVVLNFYETSVGWLIITLNLKKYTHKLYDWFVMYCSKFLFAMLCIQHVSQASFIYCLKARTNKASLTFTYIHIFRSLTWPVRELDIVQKGNVFCLKARSRNCQSLPFLC